LVLSVAIKFLLKRALFGLGAAIQVLVMNTGLVSITSSEPRGGIAKLYYATRNLYKSLCAAEDARAGQTVLSDSLAVRDAKWNFLFQNHDFEQSSVQVWNLERLILRDL
jgi:hypothetical protein